MASWRLILGSILIAALGDFVAFKYYPQSGSRFLWTFSQMKGNVMKLQNFTHKLADTFCNNPEECRNAVDECFAIATNLPKDVWLQLSELMNKLHGSSNPKEDGRVRHDEAMNAAVNYANNEIQLNSDPKKAETVIKSLKFSSYDENNLCDLMEGIPPEEYDATVDEIADLTNMPEKLRKVIKRAKNFAGGKIQAVNRLQFKTKDGNLVFGRVAVLRRGKLLDMAYSLHSVEYNLKPRQRLTEHAQKFQQFSESLPDENSDEGMFQGISVELRDDFLAFFHKQAIEGFVKHCDFVLKAMRSKNRDSDVLQHFGVHKDDKDDKDVNAAEGEKGG